MIFRQRVTRDPHEPWNPQALADEFMHHHDQAMPAMVQPAEYEDVAALVLAGGYDYIDGVWIAGHAGPQALIWPMNLGLGTSE